MDVADTTTSVRKQALALTPTFNTFVTQTPLLPDPRFLTVGGDSSSRALLRFALPAEIAESANIVRATLDLVPRTAIPGLPGDIAILEGRAVLADLGAKSPVSTDVRFIVDDTLEVGSSDTVSLDMTRIVQLWQASTTAPDAIFLSLLPEASTFTRGGVRLDPLRSDADAIGHRAARRAPAPDHLSASLPVRESLSAARARGSDPAGDARRGGGPVLPAQRAGTGPAGAVALHPLDGDRRRLRDVRSRIEPQSRQPSAKRRTLTASFMGLQDFRNVENPSGTRLAAGHSLPAGERRRAHPAACRSCSG